MEFAVKVKGEEQGRWVLAVDGDQSLTTDDEGTFRWILMADCRLIKVKTPETPQPVLMVQPNQPLAVPGLRLN